MSINLTVPDIGDFEKVEIIEILVKSGDNIKKDDSVVALESDKSSVEVPSTHEGRVEKVNVKIGDKVSKGDLLITLINSEKTNDTEEKKVVKKLPIDTENIIKEAEKVKEAEKAKDTKKVLVLDKKIEIKTKDTKEDKKKDKNEKIIITQGKDIDQTETQEYDHSEFGKIDIQPIPRIKKIARPHLQESWSKIPYATQHDEADITEMEEFRESLKDTYTGEKIKIALLAFIMRALVIALKDYPNFNSSLDIENNKVIYKKYFHIGITVDTPHGLMVPKIRNVEKKNITTLNKELKVVSEECRNLKVDKKEFYGGSMTISSLSGIGESFFTPIINFPEVAILGVGRAETKQIYFDEKFQKKIILPLSLSYDHRIIDGAEGAKFCNHLKDSLGKDFAYKLTI